MAADLKTGDSAPRRKLGFRMDSPAAGVGDKCGGDLRFAGSHQMFVPRHRRSTFGRRAFSVAGPAAWNSLPDYMRDPSRSADSFRRDLETFFSRFASVHSALEALRLCATLICY